MSDLRLFRTGNSVTELITTQVEYERSLQRLIEENSEALLGVRFVASEFTTGERHAGRIDTLGVDENNAPVIIEYKKSRDQNVINQGLFYLDWLDDHRADFTLLVMDKLGPKMKDQIVWENTRVLCIAYEFTKFDEHAVSQMGRNIELIRYRRFGDDLLALELVNAPAGASRGPKTSAPVNGKKQVQRTAAQALEKASVQLTDLFDALDEQLSAFGDDVSRGDQKYYFAYRRLRNFACVEPKTSTNSLTVFLKIDPKTVALEKGFTRDVSEIGHYGTGNLEVVIRSQEDLKRAMPLLQRSYDGA